MSWELKSDKPIYIQIIDKIKTLIVCDSYKPGESLPSVRDFSTIAGVNPNTMQRALLELEKEGLIVTQRNVGKLVTSDTELIYHHRREMAKNEVKNFIENMTTLGFTQEQIINIINETLRGGLNNE